VITHANTLIANGDIEQAITFLDSHFASNELDHEACLLLGKLLFEQQQVPESVTVFKAVSATLPDRVDVLFALAQSQFLAGYHASQTFQNIISLAPEHRQAWHGYALAVASEGNSEQAEKFLCSQLNTYSDWADGHKLLSTLRYLRGDHDSFLVTYQDAIKQHPGHIALNQNYFNLLLQNKQWDDARSFIDQLERDNTFPEFSAIAKVIIATETEQTKSISTLIQATQNIDDTALDLALVRYHIKNGDLHQAESIAMQRVAKSSALVFIPYLSLIWRVTKSPYYTWLEHNDGLIKSLPVGLSSNEIDELKQELNKLHTSKSPFIEQSVRGGTQTDQHLFLRHEPIFRTLRDKLKRVVKDYVSTLPAGDATHPLLGKPRAATLQEQVKFSGSWSVKLGAQGHNVSHTHPKGWISSALHLQLPDFDNEQQSDAGYIQFGTPPPELKLNLKPTLQLKPKVGNVVLFPSTAWHSTVPFDDGERLVVAFDVQAPRV